MQSIERAIKARVAELIEDGFARKVLGWERGEFLYDNTPTVLPIEEVADRLVYNSFCGSNISKYLIKESNKDEKIVALLKPCDTYSFNELVRENRINKDNVYILGVSCYGMVDIEKIRQKGISGIQSIEEDGDKLIVRTLYGDEELDKKELLIAKCRACKSVEHKAFDELIEGSRPMVEPVYDRFAAVEKLENMKPEERFAFWRHELSQCIRCNACRNVCPACTCTKCVFDNEASGVAGKANTDSFEENMFHIIRSYHVAGRCTDCGECSRVCPRGLPLQLLHRKFVKDINEFYGEYQAGETVSEKSPLIDYTLDDIEPDDVKGEGHA